MKIFVCILASLAIVSAGGSYIPGGRGGHGGRGYGGGHGAGLSGGYGGGLGGFGGGHGNSAISHVSRTLGATKVHITAQGTNGHSSFSTAPFALYSTPKVSYRGEGNFGNSRGLGSSGAGGWHGKSTGGYGAGGGYGDSSGGAIAGGSQANYDYTVDHSSSQSGGAYGTGAGLLGRHSYGGASSGSSGY